MHDRHYIQTTVGTILQRYRGYANTFELLKKLAADEKIAVLEADLHDISGALRFEDGAWKMYINRQDSPNRQLFTLAHELAHYFLHRDTRNDFVDGEFVMNRSEGTKFDSEELEANEFAGNLVMPAERIEKKLQGKQPSEREVIELADQFHVSPLAIAIRLQSLGYHVPTP